MEHLQYLILLGACLVVTLPLELLLQAKVYRQWRRLILTLIPVTVIFSIFDYASISWGWWHYSRRYTTGLDLLGRLPIEEIAFFVVIPICGLLTYGAVQGTGSAIKSWQQRFQKHRKPSRNR
jgi:lycopene cyclase domain-containing protein